MAPTTTDMGLAFKTRQKLAGTGSTEDKDLRRVVLLCNTYDTFQRRMNEHFCASRDLFHGMDRGDKAQISCREVAVVDEDEDSDSDSDEDYDEDDVQDAAGLHLRRQTSPPPVADGERPPPYELYLPVETTVRDFAIGVEVTADEVEDEEESQQHDSDSDSDSDSDYDSDDYSDTTHTDNPSSPPSYTASNESILMVKDDMPQSTQYVEVLMPEIKILPTPPPLPPRSTKRLLGPGLVPRVSYGNHTIGLSSEHARGVMEVH